MEREARRKRIMEGGSDRLALISGRVHSMDPLSSPNSFSGQSSTYSTPGDNYRGHAYSESDSGINNTVFFPDHRHGGDDTSNIQSRHDIFDDGDSQVKVTKFEAKVAEVEQSEVKSVLTPLSAAKPGNEVESSLVATTVSKASYDANAKPFQKPFGNLFSSRTPREINSCIITSENTRVFCSIVIAILVVLSHVNFPCKVVKSKSLIAWRPLYVVLLTDLMIVAARLALYVQRGSDKAEQDEEQRFQEDGHNWGSAIKLLEFGLVLHQTVRAVFIDCSFYLVIVVCGLSLV
ncbi:uncharacterized protein LOC111366186 [Olea europaea var. sylvestris]|uniref:uncharacterized protein LOC111366186 n=1 Tax=Olea europaea var. sylvestris TaxID=158386 RepID=UPI000C1D025D|nr:uncharacterized protein LOC111366186 [Olea europaea var. sylvestris]